MATSARPARSPCDVHAEPFRLRAMNAVDRLFWLAACWLLARRTMTLADLIGLHERNRLTGEEPVEVIRSTVARLCANGRVSFDPETEVFTLTGPPA